MINPIAPITPINERIGPIRPIRPVGPSEKSRHPSCNAGCLIFVFGLIGRIGPMGPISCDGSYRLYGIDHDGAYRFYGIDFDNGAKSVGTVSFELYPTVRSFQHSSIRSTARRAARPRRGTGPEPWLGGWKGRSLRGIVQDVRTKGT